MVVVFFNVGFYSYLFVDELQILIYSLFFFESFRVSFLFDFDFNRFLNLFQSYCF